MPIQPHHLCGWELVGSFHLPTYNSDQPPTHKPTIGRNLQTRKIWERDGAGLSMFHRAFAKCKTLSEFTFWQLSGRDNSLDEHVAMCGVSGAGFLAPFRKPSR